MLMCSGMSWLADVLCYVMLLCVQGATRKLVAPISKGCDWGQDVPAMVAALPGCQLQQQQRHLAGTLVSIRATKLA
jgi:hypothetical protein